jgi:hypothetical protein
MRRLVLIALLIGLDQWALGSRNIVCRRAVIGSIQTFRYYRELLDELKGTFEDEGLFPVEPRSIADQFPVAYQEIIKLFKAKPSHLSAINLDKLERPNMTMGWVFRDIREYSWRIGDELEFIMYRRIQPGKGGKRPTLDDVKKAREIIGIYVKRFKLRPTGYELSDAIFNNFNADQYSKITVYGKSTICSTWGELRLSLRIGRLTQVQVTVDQMIINGTLPEEMKRLLSPKIRSQEVDHVWFPYTDDYLREEDYAGSQPEPINRPYAVAIGDSKVFDTPFDENYQYRNKVYEQLERYFEVASILGAFYSLEARVYYFFIAGISAKQEQILQQKAAAFNNTIGAGVFRVPHAPIKLFVHGDYDKK